MMEVKSNYYRLLIKETVPTLAEGKSDISMADFDGKATLQHANSRS